MVHPLVGIIKMNPNAWRIVYSSGDSRSADLLHENLGVSLYEIASDYEVPAPAYDPMLAYNIIVVGLFLANPYCKKYFPNLQADYEKEIIFDYPEVSSDGKRIIKKITKAYGKWAVLIGGYAEEDTWNATNEFLQIALPIPPGFKKLAEIRITYAKVNPLKPNEAINNELWEKAQDEFYAQVAESEAYLTNPRIIGITGKAWGLVDQYEWRCDVYGLPASPAIPVVIAGILKALAPLFIAFFVYGIIILACKIVDFYTQAEITKQTKEKTDVIENKENLLAEGEISEELAIKIDETLEQVTPTAPTDWLTTIMNMMPLLIGVVLITTIISAIPRRRED